MNRTVLSVIIPVYNVELYLSACLDSVLEQTLENIEILCVNDASPDRSIDILNQYAKKDSRIKILHHKKNSGLAATRNTAIEAARGEYLFFLDSDDLLYSSASLSQLYNIAKQDDADEVIGATLRWNEETGERGYGYHKAYIKKNIRGISLDSAPFLAGNVIGCNKLLKTSFLKRHDLKFNPDLKKYEDNSFSWKVHLLAKSISVCNYTTYLHRLRDSSGPQSLMMQITELDYLYRAGAADDILIFLEKNKDYNGIRHIVDKYFMLWLQRDVIAIEDNQFDKEKKNEMLEVYHKVLSRIPESSAQHFSYIQKLLLQLMRDKQYERVWKKIRTPQKKANKAQQIKRLQNKLNAVYNSTSWRLTAPFRFTVKQIKKFF